MKTNSSLHGIKGALSEAPAARPVSARALESDHAGKAEAGIRMHIKASGFRCTALAALGLVCAAPVQAALPGYKSVVLAQDPYSFHRFNEAEGTTAADTSGNSRPGSYVNSPTLGLAGAGGSSSDNAVGFNGSDQYMTIPDAAGLGPLLKNVTFEAVFRTTSTATQYLFGTFNDSLTTAVSFGLNEASNGDNAVGTHRLFMRANDGAQLIGTFTNSDLSNGDFHHLMISVDTSLALANRYRIYVNGVAQSITTALGSPGLDGTRNFANFQYDFTVGARNLRGTFDQHFNGTIDEFAIYDKTLTAADAAAHFAAITTVPPRITAFSYNPADGSAVASLEGAPGTRFKLVEAADLDFSTPDQDPLPLLGATVGSVFDGAYVITDVNGDATVQFNLGTGPATFVRAETIESITMASFDFEVDGQGFTPSGDWAWGTPASDNGELNGQVTGGNSGSTGAWATVLGDGGAPVNGGITPTIESILRSPNINLTDITGARLDFAAAVDAASGDPLEVLVRDASDDALLGTINPFPTTFPANAAWQDLGPFDLPEDAANKTIYLQFRFVGASAVYLGFYLDDVKISF